ncbi:hypothetical protein AB0M00_43665 [Streptomyces chartreusis]|uniref:hypothetical protein n=1 Tax=Streptomyces chartreusis TaxID=1969 RepID=UPI0034122272
MTRTVDRLVSRSCPIAAFAAVVACVWLAFVEEWLAFGLVLWLVPLLLVVGGLAHRAHARTKNGQLSEVREQKERPTHPDGTPYRYHEIVAEGWGFCDGCRMWSTATVERPHQCAGDPPVAVVHRVSDEVLDGVVDELEKGDR